MSKLKVGELSAVLDLDDRLTPDLAKAGRNFERVGGGMHATGTLDADWSRLDAAARQAEGRLDQIDGETATAKIEADLSDLESAGPEVASAIGGLEDSAIGAAGALGALAGAKLADSFTQTLADDKVADRIAATLNLSDEADAQMRRVAESLHEGLSVDTIGEGLGAVEAVKGTFRELGDVSDTELGNLASDVHTLASAFDASDAEIAASASALFEQGLVPTYQQGLDVMAAMVGEVGVNMRGDLLAIFTEGEYLEFFNRLGFGADEMGGALITAAEDGSFALDKLPDALAEFQKLLTDDMTPDAEAAFNTLGLNAADFRAELQKGGPEGRKAFEEIIAAMGRLDQAGQRRVARQLFGTPGEDIGADKLIQAFTPSEGALGELDQRARAMGRRQADQFGAGWEGGYREWENDLKRGWTRVLDDPVKTIGGGAADWYVGRWQSIFEELPGLAGGAVEEIEGFLGEVPGWIGGAWEQVEDLFGRIPEGLGAIFDPVEEILTAPFRAAAEAWNALDPSIHVSVPDWVPGIGGRSLDIDDVFPDIPTFHGGGTYHGAGTFRAGAPGGEGLAMLKDGETVSRPGLGGQGFTWTGDLIVQGTVLTQQELYRGVEQHLSRVWMQRGGRA